MTAEDTAAAPSASHFRDLARGERLAGFVYGTILTLSVVVAGARAFPHDPGHVAELVAVTSVVFWVAHVYAHWLGESVSHGGHLSFAELRWVTSREWSLVEAAVPPVAALLLGAAGLLSEQAAVWLAFGLGLGVLFVEGIVFARIERLGLLPAVLVVLANLGFGLLLVALKLVVGH
ncbi:MAG TPA: hypothetical protein VLD16_16465 [Gaiellaceae bacterium]|nr:hypothetical protein [Gaiellaceae bacterium]